MPGKNSNETGPVELLLSLNQDVLRCRERIRSTRFKQRTIILLGFLVIIIVASCWVATELTWRRKNMAPVNFPAFIIVGLFSGIIIWIVADFKERGYKPVPQLELELEVAEERRRLYSASLNLPIGVRRFAYRDYVPVEILALRRDGGHYRRIHNVLQAVIIIGSIGTSTIAGLSSDHPNFKWATVGTSFAVGVAAGFTGYFKFRERSFYLQQTADSIEQELSAVDLRIGTYADKEDGEALGMFTERIEMLKIEQRKRQQQLDQPAEGREGTV